jgi:signal transduction histidine kinase
MQANFSSREAIGSPGNGDNLVLSFAESATECATRTMNGSAAETRSPATRLERWQRPIFMNAPFSMSILHDLRNPLASICTCAEMLMDPHVAPERVKRIGRNIQNAAERIHELLASLIDTREAMLAPLEICDLRELLAAVCDGVAVTADMQGVDIHLDLPAGLKITILRARMERVFLNLITNALEAMPNGGRIRIEARLAADDVLIEVEDSGPGIPPEIYTRLFDPFVTAGKKSGLGLGLALSRWTVRDHGGDMWLEPASGARFVIRLPLKRNFEPIS